ncbi:WD40 repeat-like protein [Suillus brevipes Sb2]|nr:WD40 repeat-like protein [Suillus brevipes Sb2]
MHIALCWSADGNRVVSGSWDGTARVWDINSGKNILTIKTGRKWMSTMTYSPDSSKLATGGDEENAVKIWDAKTGKRLTTLKHGYTVTTLAWTSDGKKLISGSYGPIRIFDTATWQQIAILEGHTGFVTAISLSPNNRLLASASYDKTARLWNLDTNLPVGPPLQHEHHQVNSASLSPNGKVLVTACENNAYTWDVHAILREAGLEDLLLIGPNIRTPRSSIDNKSFLKADATQCPGQFGGGDELPPAFFAGMEADVDSSMGRAHPHSSVNALLARLSSLLHRFRPDNGESAELPQPSRHLAFHIHALIARLSALIHRSPPETDAPDEPQQPSTPSRVDSRVLLARISSFLHRSRLNTDEEAESHRTTPLSSRPGALITRLSSLFHSQPHTNEEIELAQRPSRPRVVEVAAVRDKQALVVARGPKFMKALRAHLQQSQSHAQAQASSLHVQFANASTSATHPVPGTAAPQPPPPIPWWAHIVLFLCCTSPHANGC